MPTGPIITLTTDFGLTDFYVAAMKAVLLSYCPNATLMDITHQVFRHDVRSGSFTLERAVDAFGNNTIHLAVVDPGVGTNRRLMVTQINSSIVVCPDNGLITWAWRRYPGAKAHELTWRPSSSSNTFHGRDVMAPVAGMIAGGRCINDFIGSEILPVLLEMQPAAIAAGEVIHIDHFGNATTNIPAALVTDRFVVARVADNTIPIHRTYGEVKIGDPLALIGSSELLEIAVRNGSAADMFQLKIGDGISLS